MPERIKIEQWREQEGLQDKRAFIDAVGRIVVGTDNAPAMCEDGCEVEPDSFCPHGHPSLLIALGIC